MSTPEEEDPDRKALFKLLQYENKARDLMYKALDAEDAVSCAAYAQAISAVQFLKKSPRFEIFQRHVLRED